MKRVAIDAISENRWTFSKSAIRRVVNFWRTAATELPGPELALPEPALATAAPADADIVAERYQFQTVWSWRPRWLEAWIEHRWSRSVRANNVLAAITGIATSIMVLHRPTRPFGIWIAMIFAYFSIITGLIEVPTYRYRMVIEPLAAVAVGCGWTCLREWIGGRSSRRGQDLEMADEGEEKDRLGVAAT